MKLLVMGELAGLILAGAPFPMRDTPIRQTRINGLR
jgi:hypothetical protein